MSVPLQLSYLLQLETLCLSGTSVKLLSLRYLARKFVDYHDPGIHLDVSVPSKIKHSFRLHDGVFPDPFLRQLRFASISRL